jgi:hypothetical protein
LAEAKAFNARHGIDPTGGDIDERALEPGGDEGTESWLATLR